MRDDISINRVGWLHRLDHKKLIIIAFLIRFIFASMYDVFVAVTDKDPLLPDSKFYSVMGRYVALVLNRYGKDDLTRDMIPRGRDSLATFLVTLSKEQGRLPSERNESNLFSYIVGIIYFVFGYFPLGVRTFNILLSIGSAYLMFRIARRHFGDLAANLFLLVALFLPTQFGYSITMSRDFVRVFIISFILWVIYG